MSARAPLGKPRPFRLAAPVVPEHALQRSMADTLRLEIAPAGKVSRFGVCWYSIDQALYGGEVPGIRIGRGIVAGVPDTYMLWRGQSYFIEIKTPDGQLSEAQKAVASAVLMGGGHVGVVASVEQLLDALDEWRVPRARRVRVAA
ncbi:MAG: hypothetical protein ACJ8AI_10235 [Rhodopila sp.]